MPASAKLSLFQRFDEKAALILEVIDVDEDRTFERWFV